MFLGVKLTKSRHPLNIFTLEHQSFRLNILNPALSLFKWLELFFRLPFFSENEPQKTFVIKRACLVVIIPMWHLEPAFRQSTHIHCQAVALTVKDFDCLLGFAYEDKGLVLGKVAPEYPVHYALQTLELLTHIHWLHAQIVSEVCM